MFPVSVNYQHQVTNRAVYNMHRCLTDDHQLAWKTSSPISGNRGTEMKLFPKVSALFILEYLILTRNRIY